MTTPPFTDKKPNKKALTTPLPIRNRSRRVVRNLNQNRRGAPSSGRQTSDVRHRIIILDCSHTIMSDTLFNWQSSGPNLLVGAIATITVIGMGYLWCRTPKGRVVGIIFFGAWAVYVPFVFIGFKIWPEEVSISSKEIQGRHNFSRFSLQAADILTIQGSRSGKGGYSLHVSLKSKNEAVGIPVIWDKDKDTYKIALRKLCPDADLDW